MRFFACPAPASQQGGVAHDVIDADELLQFVQLRLGADFVNLRIEFVAFTWFQLLDCPALTAVVPVSYTHLDVYKRQALGDTFLENLQGLTTLKIYQADEFKNKEMNVEACLLYTSRCV